jgi:hypothetical protein
MELTYMTACKKFLARAQQMFTITVSEKVLHCSDSTEQSDGILIVLNSMERQKLSTGKIHLFTVCKYRVQAVLTPVF